MSETPIQSQQESTPIVNPHSQTEKFKERNEKTKAKKAANHAPIKPLLTLGQLTDLNFKAKKTPRKPLSKISTARLSRLLANINPAEVNDKAEFEANYQSIQSVINRMHPDIKKLFHRGTVNKYVATADHLTIHLDNTIILQVTPLHNKQNHYHLVQRINSHKKNVLLDITG